MMQIFAALAIVLLVCLCFLAAMFTAVCLCALRGRKIPQADCLLVLGAKVKPDGSMSNALRLRCERALQVWNHGAVKKIIACGGVCGGPVSEAATIHAFLVEHGMPAEHVLLEDRSVNTWENLINARKIMDEHGLRTAMLVTSDYHLTRAIWMARKQNLPVKGVASLSSRKPSHFIRTRSRETVSWIIYFWNEIKKAIKR